MSILDIFSPTTINKAVDAVINTGDALVYTDEEKAKALQLGTDTKLKMLSQFAPFKIAQRYIALFFTLNFILSFWVGVLFLVLDFKFDDYLKLVGVFQLFWIMVAIVTFYFGGGFIESGKRIDSEK